jgi:integrase/recombinase XerD
MELWNERKRTGVNFGSWDSVYKHLNNFNKTVLLTEINERFMEEFKAYLLSKVKQNSASQYFNIFKHSIHEAFRRKLIRDNPAENVKYIKEVETHREYLTKEEIGRLIETECRYEVLKRAFLFSCFTGLRWSDINKLTWKEVRLINEVHHIVYTQKKTKHSEVLPIPANAVQLMGERKEDEERVFVGLKYSDYFNTALLRWCLKAGITKHITFHCGRHTNAILLLNNGVDIFTVSKMLGHKELSTTAIYAKVMNDTKIDAINKLPVFEF